MRHSELLLIFLCLSFFIASAYFIKHHYYTKSDTEPEAEKDPKSDFDFDSDSIMASVVPAISKQTATIIFLHGLGDTGHGWADIMSSYRPKYAKLICPHASSRPVTLNGGYVMPAWWDIRSLDKLDGNEDEAGIKECSIKIQALIQSEIDSGIPAERIVLGGFSQGAATALYTGLTGKFGGKSLAGIVALSGYLPARNTIPWETVNKSPIFQAHGTADSVVSYSIGEYTRDILKSKVTGNFTFKSYPGVPHSSSPEEMDDVRSFLKEVLPPLKE